MSFAYRWSIVVLASCAPDSPAPLVRDPSAAARLLEVGSTVRGDVEGALLDTTSPRRAT